jgi:hypothetical protein
MEVSCPISPYRVNEIVVRIIAFFVVLLGIACLLTQNYYAIFLLTIDFAIRAFTSGKLSLLKILSLQIFKVISVQEKLTDLAPKKFAAILGFMFCLFISLLYLFHFYNGATILTLILIVFAVLESMFAVCVGCYLYTFLKKIGYKK